MNTLKTITLAFVLTFFYVAEDTKGLTSSSYNCCISSNYHDWECKYIIEESYSEDGKDARHYVDNYTINVDDSISFVDEGKSYRIPYPYYLILKNEN